MIPLFKTSIANSTSNLLLQTLNSGYITQGKIVDEFEKRLSNYLWYPYVVTLNSCTSAIHLSLFLLKEFEKLSDDTVVLSTSQTCAATNIPILLNRLRLKWVDIEKDTLNIDLNKVEENFSKDTRILIVVHSGGIPINYDKLLILKQRYYQQFNQELFIVEDCAHAWDAYFCHKHVGTFGNFACFSCQAIKNLTTGDGGVLLTPKEYYKRARLARWFGIDRDNQETFRHLQDIKTLGFKFHMNDLAASLGLANLEILRERVDQQRAVAQYYLKNLDSRFEPPRISSEVIPSFWLFTIKVKKREKFIKYMYDNGIETNPVHTRNDKYTIFKDFQRELPVLDSVFDKICCIPCGWWVTEPDYIVEKVNNYDE